MKRTLKLGIATALVIAVAGCGSNGSSNNNAPAVVLGAFAYGSPGGAGVMGGGGPTMQLMAQQDIKATATGSVPAPVVSMGPSPTIISVDMDWTDADNMVYPDGFQINAGVTVTVPDDLGAGGLDITVNGPAVIAGRIVRGPNTTGFNVGVSIDADEEIVLSGIIDLTGPDNSAGNGVPGGAVMLNNDYAQDAIFGIYVAGTILLDGGNATGAAGNGGAGGALIINGGDNEDIHIGANISNSGGDGVAGLGNGGSAGIFIAVNSADSYGVPTDDSTGSIYFYNSNSFQLNGQTGEGTGGSGGIFLALADRGSVEINVPFYAKGGDATNASGQGGAGGVAQVMANGNAVESLDDANVILSSAILTGGDADKGGPGGIFLAMVQDGNFYGSGAIDVSGGDGDSLVATEGGGNAGVIQITVTDVITTVEDFWVAWASAVLDGGDGGDDGGNSGTMIVTDPTQGFIYLSPGNISMQPGDAVTTPGSFGTLVLTGSVVSIAAFPNFLDLP